MPIKRRTIGAHDLAVIAAIKKNVGMIEWRIGADAHEFLRADLYGGDAGVVVKVGNMMIGHEQTFRVSALLATISALEGNS